jgi:glutamate racemase
MVPKSGNRFFGSDHAQSKKILMSAPAILVFDSGLGGLTVFKEIRAARPDARLVYLADDERFPYGDIPEAELIERVRKVIGDAIAAHRPDLIVIACNTASTLALKDLREKFTVPFVGTVPAIKPACARSRSRLVSVLGTQATVSREYTHALIREFANGCDVKLVGSSKLARMAEAELSGAPASDAEIAAEIAPCFVEQNGARTDAVVLACTHYPLLLERFRKLAPWPVEWIDPAPAIARRVADLLGPAMTQGNGGPPLFIFTSGRTTSPALTRSFTTLGLATVGG